MTERAREAGANLTQMQVAAVCAIGARPGISYWDLQDRMDAELASFPKLDPDAALEWKNRVLDLYADDLFEPVPDASDRVGHRYWLSPKGEAVYRAMLNAAAPQPTERT